ncbi:prostaglandin E receptor 2b subtype EP2 [Lampris incognitus]|uniref:prostaglandin E receptor 2b subtype EP2 n=1 Tax=Lampris incognitus TaxID=2546036 RepID=UPI0024B5AE5B|nr:prostaglandin E receptor 2b subtype EP2 [Lampris incognitus]
MDNESTDYLRCHDRATVESGEPTMSAVMFSVALAGNIIALLLLVARRRRKGPSLFQVLVTALIVTDLLGTIAVSPVVLASYATNQTLVGMSSGREVCAYFSFSMTFLSLSTLAILCAMALERYFSIGHPYFYERHFSERCGYVTVALIYLTCIPFCATPFVGFGSYEQYCPGTWCFLDMSPSNPANKVYTGMYASLALVMIVCTATCNVSVIYHLAKMHRRGKIHRTGAPHRPFRVHLRSLSMTEEVEHLLQLVLMTLAFTVCSFPLVLQVYINFTGQTKDSHLMDLNALRMLSFNSIIDPWVLIIPRSSVLEFLWRKLRGPRRPKVGRDKPFAAQLTPRADRSALASQ